jgi:TetR/AcrR family transcriptional regulator
MTRVMIGDALVNEDERLQLRMNQFVERIEMALRQSWKIAASQGDLPENEASARAAMVGAVRASSPLPRRNRCAAANFRVTRAHPR